MSNERVTRTGHEEEDSYFYRKDQELLSRKRAELDALRHTSASMKCPRCGAATTEVAIEHFKIDRCTGCGGVFLDKGELELLTHRKSGGFFRRLFGR